MLTLPHVRRYQELGLVVHPCCPPDHRCQSPGKIPFDPIAGRHMVGWASHEQFTAEQWQDWLDYESSINIGFLCGSPSAVVCIDIDNTEGIGVLNDHGITEWRETWQFTTGRGHRSIFRFRHRCASFNLTSGDSSVEVLGDGKQSVLPPSLHPNGKRYEWVDPYSPRDCECRDAGDWVSSRGSDGEITSDREDWRGTISEGALKGNRNTVLTRLAGHLLNPGPMPAEEAYIWLKLYNERYCKPPVSDREIKAVVRSISKKETAVQAQRDREIGDLMRRYQMCRQDAETMWRTMQAQV